MEVINLKSVLLQGQPDQLTYPIYAPYTDINSGKWKVCVGAIMVHFEEDMDQFIAVKTNLVRGQKIENFHTLFQDWPIEIFHLKGVRGQNISVPMSCQKNWYSVNAQQGEDEIKVKLINLNTQFPTEKKLRVLVQLQLSQYGE